MHARVCACVRARACERVRVRERALAGIQELECRRVCAGVCVCVCMCACVRVGVCACTRVPHSDPPIGPCPAGLSAACTCAHPDDTMGLSWVVAVGAGRRCVLDAIRLVRVRLRILQGTAHICATTAPPLCGPRLTHSPPLTILPCIRTLRLHFTLRCPAAAGARAPPGAVPPDGDGRFRRGGAGGQDRGGVRRRPALAGCRVGS